MKRKLLLFASLTVLLILMLTGCPNGPRSFTLTITSSPDEGIQIIVNLVNKVTPFSQKYQEGTTVDVQVTSPQERDTSAFVPGNDTKYTFQQWNDASNENPRNVTVNSNVTYTAQMGVQYKVETSSNPAGAAVTAGGWHNKNANATLTAPARDGYNFSHWVVNGVNAGSTNPLVIAVDNPKNIVAHYTPDVQYTLTLTTLPDLALDVRIDGTLYSSPKGMVVQGGTSKQISVDTPQQKDISPWLTGIDARYTFANWDDANTSNPRNVTINSDVTYTAVMNAEYRVDFSASPTLWETGVDWIEGGSLRGFNFSGNLGPYNFSHWLVNGQNLGSARPLELFVDKPYNVTAVFAMQQPDYTLTVTTSPHTGLNISIGGTNYLSPKSVVLSSGSSTQIGVTSPQNKDTSPHIAGNDTRYTFQQWNDTNTQNPRDVTLYSDTTYTAEMKLEYLVATSSNPAGATIGGAGWHIAGSIVNFTAPAREGYTFSHWVINGANAGAANPIGVTIDNPKNVVAHYVAAASKNIWGNVTPYTGNVKTASIDDLETLSNPDIRTVPQVAEYAEGEYILRVTSFRDVENDFKTAALRDIEIVRRIESADGDLRFILVKTTAGMESLESLSGVLDVSRNYFYYPLATIPNDPFYPSQWHYPVMNLPQAWDYTVGSRSVVVAVIDSGFSINHPDLTGVFTAGYNFIDDNSDVSEPMTSNDSHGTHVAGTIAALSNNGIGVAGVTWGGFGISMIPIRGIKDSATLISSLLYAVDHGAKIINMSLGGPAGTTALHNAIKYADRNGVVMVAAAGNNGDRNILYPAKYAETIAVGAVWKDGSTIKRSDYSCYGEELDVVAPGGWMTSYTDPNGVYSTGWTPSKDTYMYMQGTSMAAPHVTGLVALLMGAGLTDPDDIRQTLRNTATDLGAAGRDDFYGYGLVDAEAALVSITTPQPFKVFLRNASTGVDIANTTIADSGAFGFSNVSLTQVKIWAWRDMDDSGTVNTGDLLGYYNYNGGKPNLNNAQTINLSTGDNWIDFMFAPIVDN